MHGRWSSPSVTQKIVWINILVLFLYSAGINLLMLYRKAESVAAPVEHIDEPSEFFADSYARLSLAFVYFVGAGLQILGNLTAALLSFTSGRRNMARDFLFSAGGVVMFGTIFWIVSLVLYDVYDIFL